MFMCNIQEFALCSEFVCACVHYVRYVYVRLTVCVASVYLYRYLNLSVHACASVTVCL